jgi:hypothetical protein
MHKNRNNSISLPGPGALDSSAIYEKATCVHSWVAFSMRWAKGPVGLASYLAPSASRMKVE